MAIHSALLTRCRSTERSAHSRTQPRDRQADIPSAAYIALTVTIPPRGASRLSNVIRSGPHLGHPTACEGCRPAGQGFPLTLVTVLRRKLGMHPKDCQRGRPPGETVRTAFLTAPRGAPKLAWTVTIVSASCAGIAPLKSSSAPARWQATLPPRRVPRVTTGSRRRGGASVVSRLVSPEGGTGGNVQERLDEAPAHRPSACLQRLLVQQSDTNRTRTRPVEAASHGSA